MFLQCFVYLQVYHCKLRIQTCILWMLFVLDSGSLLTAGSLASSGIGRHLVELGVFYKMVEVNLASLILVLLPSVAIEIVNCNVSWLLT